MSTNEGFGRHILLLRFNVTKAELISCLLKQMILIINLKNLLKISDDQAAPGKIFLEEVTTSVLSAETNPNKII